MQSPNFVITFAFVLSTTVSGAKAHAHLACEEIFASASYEIYNSGPDRQTVRIVEIDRDSRGETRYVLRKLLEETTWSSKFAPRGFDPQGDVSVIFQTLGFPLARVLGFGWNRRGDILAPTPETLNGRIAAFNRFLKKKKIEPIPATFYLQAKPILESFLLKWSTEFGQPVASGSTTHTIHDISFHYVGGILLPPAIARVLSAEATFAAAWMRFNRQTRPEASWLSAELIDIVSTSNNTYEDETPSAENLQGFLGQYLASEGSHAREHFAAYAARLTPLDIFHRKLLVADGVPFAMPDVKDEIEWMRHYENEPSHKAFFLAQMRREYPKLNRTLKAFGLKDFATVEALYTKRSTELRQAAEEFLSDSRK